MNFGESVFDAQPLAGLGDCSCLGRSSGRSPKKLRPLFWRPIERTSRRTSRLVRRKRAARRPATAVAPTAAALPALPPASSDPAGMTIAVQSPAVSASTPEEPVPPGPGPASIDPGDDWGGDQAGGDYGAADGGGDRVDSGSVDHDGSDPGESWGADFFEDEGLGKLKKTFRRLRRILPFAAIAAPVLAAPLLASGGARAPRPSATPPGMGSGFWDSTIGQAIQQAGATVVTAGAQRLVDRLDRGSSRRVAPGSAPETASAPTPERSAVSPGVLLAAGLAAAVLLSGRRR